MTDGERAPEEREQERQDDDHDEDGIEMIGGIMEDVVSVPSDENSDFELLDYQEPLEGADEHDFEVVGLPPNTTTNSTKPKLTPSRRARETFSVGE